jgi:hypothetical protein
MWPPKNSLNICTVKFAVCAIAPSCWNQQSCLSASKRETKFHDQFLVTFSCYHFTEENGTNGGLVKKLKNAWKVYNLVELSINESKSQCTSCCDIVFALWFGTTYFQSAVKTLNKF